MVNLFDVYDEYYRDIIKKYNIEIENRLINNEEYDDFLNSTNRMTIEDMEKVYDRLDDYWAEQEEKDSTQK